MNQVELYIPTKEDFWFYQKMTSDPATMSYNANWNLDCPGYHNDTGCIDYADEDVDIWYEGINNEPESFYAYIRRCSDGQFVGEVNFHHTPEEDWWDMGIVMYAPYRGKGYAEPAFRLMLDHAFRDCGIPRIHNCFEISEARSPAWKVHQAVGFKQTGIIDGNRHLMLTREDYLAQNP